MLAVTNSPQFRYTLDSDLLGPLRVAAEPTEWDQLALTLHRDTKTHGTATEYSTRLGFVKDGAAYLRRAYAAGGVGVAVRLLIEQLDPNAFGWLPYYQGRIDFTGAELAGTKVTVAVEPDTWLQKFLSRDAVSVDLFSGTSVGGASGPVPTPCTVELHSRAILQRYAASQKNAVTTASQMYGGDGDASHEQLLYFGFDAPELNELSLGAVTGGWVDGDAYSAVPIYTSTASGSYTIELNLNYHVEAHTLVPNNAATFRTVEGDCQLRIGYLNGSADTVKLVPDYYQTNLDGDYVADFATSPRTLTVTLQEGESIYLYARFFVHQVETIPAFPIDLYRASISNRLNPGSYLRVSAVTTTAPTATTGLLLYEAFERVAQALTDEVDVFRSDFLGRPDCSVPYPADGPGALTLLTGGFQVRGFPLPSAPAPASGTDPRKSLTTTWRELFDSCAAVYGLGWGLEWVVNRAGRLAQVIRVEPLAYWYRQEVVLDLTAAGPLDDTVRVSAGDCYQQVSVTYNQWQAQQANGLDEPNAKREWTTPLSVVKNAYALASQLSASGILLETTRRDRYDETATTDTSRDATGFLVCLLRTAAGGLETERNQQALLLEGVLSPATVYNLRLTPARVLRRHGQVLRAALLPTPDALVRYATGEGNTTMRSQLVGELAAVAENGDVPVADLPAPLWRVERAGFRVPLTRAQLHALLARPAGRVRYLDHGGRVRAGWVLDCQHKASDELADFTLLCCA